MTNIFLRLIGRMIFSPDADGTKNIFPATDSEKRYVAAIVSEVESRVYRGEKILELASGNGAVGIRIFLDGYDIDLSEIDESRLEEISENLTGIKRKPNVFKFDVHSLPKVCHNSYDFVLVMDSMHHFDNISSASKECYKVLKKYGMVMITEKNWFNPMAHIGSRIFSKIYNTWKEQTLSPWKLRKTLEDSGFERIEFGHIKKSWFPLSNPIVITGRKMR